jgi:hypothetical protein
MASSRELQQNEAVGFIDWKCAGLCIARSDLLTFISSFHQLETDLISIKNDVWGHSESAPDFLVVLMRDNHTQHRLPIFGEFVLHVAHVTECLSDHYIAGSTLLQFEHQQALLVFADS